MLQSFLYEKLQVVLFMMVICSCCGPSSGEEEDEFSCHVYSTVYKQKKAPDRPTASNESHPPGKQIESNYALAT